MFNTNKEILFFDFDGVIVDSNKIKYDAFFEIWNSRLSNEIVQNSLLLGGDRTNIIDRIYKSDDIFRNSGCGPKLYVEAYSKIVHKKIIKVGISKDIFSFLEETKKTLFIISATPQKELINLCSDLKIDKYFSGIFGTPNSKKENFNVIFKSNNFKVEDTIFFGDMLSDQNAAKDMNIQFSPVFSKESDLLPVSINPLF